jgi:hypothetical protein
MQEGDGASAMPPSSVVEALFGPSPGQSVPTGARKGKKAVPAPQEVVGEVVEEPTPMEDDAPDAASVIDDLERQLAEKDRLLKEKSDALQRCEEELSALKEQLKRPVERELRPLWQMLRDAEIAEGIPPEQAYTEAMGRQEEERRKAAMEKAAKQAQIRAEVRKAKEDAEAEAWMRSAMGGGPSTGPPAAAPAAAPAPAPDAGLQDALRELIKRAERLLPELRRHGLYDRFATLYTFTLENARDALAKNQEIDGQALFMTISEIEEAERELQKAQQRAYGGFDDDEEDGDDDGDDGLLGDQPDDSDDWRQPLDLDDPSVYRGKAKAKAPAKRKPKAKSNADTFAPLIRRLRALINRANRLKAKLRKAGLDQEFADLYEGHVRKAEEVLTKQQYYAYVVTMYAFEDRLKAAEKALAERSN